MTLRGRLIATPSSQLALVISLAQPLFAADGTPGPRVYCPLPEAGEVPACLDPAQQTYGEFFSALDAEGVDADSLAPVEDAVGRGSSSEHAYLALSSLTYGYYRLAARAASSGTADPEVVERLVRWNDLLANAYAESAEDPAYRAAVRQAAEELHARAPIALPCRDASGEAVACTSTERVLRGFNAASEDVGLRGALERVVRRLFGESAP
jgi:hypothetical protein